MTPALHQLVSTLRLQLRNRMGMIYGYLFPTIFLISFWVLYRYEPVPLIRHLGELLTVTALGGACFGLPTALVSERERGVWRRYRLAPVSTGTLVTSTVAARYLLLLSAALLQLLLAMLFGMPLPDHPLQLWIAFTFVAFAFLGLGLVIAMLADNVPAVQALGQSIFLPMLIIGGVAVRLDSLPAWAQHLSAFFPGRYAVEALQASATGAGLREAGFALLALTLIGAAGCVTAAKMFRWDAQERFVSRGGKGWITVALGAWVLVGLLGESGGWVEVVRRGTEQVAVREAVDTGSAETSGRGANASPGTAGSARTTGTPTLSPTAVAGTDTAPSTPPALADTPDSASTSDTRSEPTEGPRPASPEDTSPGTEDTSEAEAQGEGDAPAAAGAASDRPSAGAVADTPVATRTPAETAAAPPERGGNAPWASVTLDDIRRDINFDALPPDGGVVTPIAAEGTEPDRFIAEQLDCLQQWLPEWEPAQVRDPVQRARNILDVAAAADLYQMEAIESLVPHIVFDQLRDEFPEDQLVKILYWIAMHPDEGDPPAVDKLSLVCLDAYGTVNMDEFRLRTAIYAVKLLGRLTGFITPR